MKVSLPQFALLATALLCSSPSFAKAPTYTLDGKGFDVSYTGSKNALSLSADGTSIVFDNLKAKGGLDSASEFASLTLTLDSGYTFSSLTLNAQGLYSVGNKLFSGASAGLVSTIDAGSLWSLQAAADSTGILKGGSGQSWSLNNFYSLASSPFAKASTLNLNSALSLVTGQSSSISTSSYSLKVATSAVQITPSVPTVPTVPAVPEPGEWAMMLAGLGMIGTIMMRRTQRS